MRHFAVVTRLTGMIDLAIAARPRIQRDNALGGLPDQFAQGLWLQHLNAWAKAEHVLAGVVLFFKQHVHPQPSFGIRPAYMIDTGVAAWCVQRRQRCWVGAQRGWVARQVSAELDRR